MKFKNIKKIPESSKFKLFIMIFLMLNTLIAIATNATSSIMFIISAIVFMLIVIFVFLPVLFSMIKKVEREEVTMEVRRKPIRN